MDLAKVLAELKKELENLDAAIISLERLQSSKKRGAATRGDEDGQPQEADGTGQPEQPATPKPRGRPRQLE